MVFKSLICRLIGKLSLNFFQNVSEKEAFYLFLHPYPSKKFLENKFVEREVIFDSGNQNVL